MHKKIWLPKKAFQSKKTSFENSQHMSDFLGFCFVVTLNLYRIPFLAVVVLGSEHEFLFKSTSTHCAVEVKNKKKESNKFTYICFFNYRMLMLIVFLVLALNLKISEQHFLYQQCISFSLFATYMSPPPLCFEQDFTQTFSGNQDVTVK